MTQKQVEALQKAIDRLECEVLLWIHEASLSNNEKEKAILEEVHWMAHSAESELGVGNFQEADTLYGYARELLRRSNNRMTNNKNDKQ